MKKSILTLAIAVALPLATTSTLTLADYRMHIAMETPQGGSLPQGSITFGNGGAVTPPVEPTEPSNPEPVQPEEPVPVDPLNPFEPEDSRCDPYSLTWPESEYGKETNVFFAFTQFDENNPSGKKYRACKLKDANKPDLLLQFQDGISVANYNQLNSKWVSGNLCDSAYNPNVNSATCNLETPKLTYYYNVVKDTIGSSFTPLSVEIWTTQIENKIAISDVGRVMINGTECTGFIPTRAWGNGTVGPVISGKYRCNYNVSYESLTSIIGKPYLVEMYRK